MSKIENWYVFNDTIVGEVYGDHRYADGTTIRTSAVVKLDKETGRVTTKNTEYELGAPMPEGDYA